MHGRYPDHDVLAQSHRWDEPTRSVVIDRLQQPAYRYFQQDEIETLEVFCDAITAQDEEPRIEVLRYVDHNLSEARGPGHRYADIPEDGETWRIVARGLFAHQVAGPTGATMPALPVPIDPQFRAEPRVAKAVPKLSE